MTDLEYFDQQMRIVADLERESREKAADARLLEEDCLKRLGITHVQRDPGFPCWERDGKRWFDSPRQALEGKK